MALSAEDNQIGMVLAMTSEAYGALKTQRKRDASEALQQKLDGSAHTIAATLSHSAALATAWELQPLVEAWTNARALAAAQPSDAAQAAQRRCAYAIADAVQREMNRSLSPRRR